MSTDVSKSLSTFKTWISENGIKGSEKFDISDFESTGRGIEALEDIESGSSEAQLFIPRSLLLTVKDTLEHPVLGKVLKDPSVQPLLKKYESATMAIRLLYEKSLPNSLWKPYIDLLPSTYNSTIYWSDSDLAFLAEGNLYHITKQHKNQINEEYASLIKGKLFKKFPQIFAKKDYKPADYKWAIATVWSRAVDLEIEGTNDRVLVPFFDMFNHSFDAKSNFTYSSNAKGFELTLESAVGKGSQVFIDYGAMGNSKLLSFYGFTVPENPHDYVELVLQLAPQADMYQLKAHLLQQHGISTTHVFHLKLDELMEDFPVKILGTARIQRLYEEDLPRVKYAFDREEIISELNEVQVLKALEEGLRSMYSAYKFDTKKDLEDYHALKSGSPNSTNHNENHALRIRMSDKNIIALAGNHITERLNQIQEYLINKIESGKAEPLGK